MTQADSVLSTPPTNTPVDPTRRRFLSTAASAATGGAVLALATVQPAPATTAPAIPLDAANASPGLRAATIALDEAHGRLKEARAAFDAADKLPEEWRRLNRKPTDRRAVKKWNR